MSLKNLRLAAGITQEKLGQKIGVKKNTICAYEKRTRTPKIETLFLLAEALGVSVEEVAKCFEK